MNKKLLKLFEGIKKQNNEQIRKYSDKQRPMIFMIHKDYKLTIMLLVFNSTKEKLLMKKRILKFIASHNIKGYMMVMPAKMTKMSLDNKSYETHDVYLRSLHTPKESIYSTVFHKDKEIIDEWDNSNMIGFKDEWSLWGENIPDDEKYIEEYEKLKKEHPDEFKNVI
ncbi:MAG: hypothetical protein ACFFDN_06905 [Candidatus Hodarchaeota archaeon]